MCIDDSCMNNRMCTVFTRIVDLLKCFNDRYKNWLF